MTNSEAAADRGAHPASRGARVDPVPLQRVVNAMKRFGLLPQQTTFNVASMIEG